MTPEKLDPLLTAGPDRSLDGLEGAVWTRLAAREAADRRLGQIASVQAALFVATLIGSAVVGGMATNPARAEAPALGIFSTHPQFAPSTRLAGQG